MAVYKVTSASGVSLEVEAQTPQKARVVALRKFLKEGSAVHRDETLEVVCMNLTQDGIKRTEAKE